jgi:hypothetical protein
MSHPPDRIPVGQFGLPELSFGRLAGRCEYPAPGSA